MKYFTNKWQRRVRDYCDAKYELIKVFPGKINFYYKCHLVASHFAKIHNHDKVAVVMYRDKKSYLPNVHFVNYDGCNFIDNTLGQWSELYEYRFIRWVSKEEFLQTDTILTDLQTYFANKATFLERLFGKTGRI